LVHHSNYKQVIVIGSSGGRRVGGIKLFSQPSKYEFSIPEAVFLVCKRNIGKYEKLDRFF
jgi:hypothetical protein